MFYFLDEERIINVKLLVKADSPDEAIAKYSSGDFVEISESLLTNKMAVISCIVNEEKQNDLIVKRAMASLENIESYNFKEKNNKRKKRDI
jgi:hypothetical protein